MALILTVPTLDDKTIITAETRPQNISKSLTLLHSENILDIASHLFRELEILNRQKVSPSKRLQALDTYRPLLIQTAQALAEVYSKAYLPLHNNAKIAANAAELLWLELGYGYKLALIDLQNQLIKLGTGKNSAHAIQLAMHAVSEQAMVCYQTYVALPNHIWSDLHQLYFCAAQLGVQHFNLDNASQTTKENASSALTKQSISIENTYKMALLMSLSDSQHLAQKDIRLIADYLTYHVDSANITTATTFEMTTGTFIISLKSNKQPALYINQNEVLDPASNILLQTMDLIRAMHEDLSVLQNQHVPKNGSIPANANSEDYIHLLTYLIKHWGITPKRFYNRSAKNGELEVVSGILAIHQTSDNGIQKTNVQIDKILKTGINIQLSLPSCWQILNISATGMSIRRHATAEKNINIGSLLGIRIKGEQHWSLGIVRWASCGKNEKLEIGVQLIAPQAQRASAVFNGMNHHEMVLLVPQITAAKQLASLIAPIGTYKPARQLTLTHDNLSKQVMLTKLIERSSHFERMQYSVIG